MSNTLTIEAAQARLEARRATLGIADWRPPEVAGPLAVAVPPMGRMVACVDCTEVGTWIAHELRSSPDIICPDCAEKRRLKEMRDLPLSVVFSDAGIGRQYWKFDEERLKRNEGRWQGPGKPFPMAVPGWPIDSRRGVRQKLETWCGDPRFVTLTGANGNGKTTLAVELARRAYREFGHRYGAKSVFLIRPRHLFNEQFADEKPRTSRALRSPITILDEAFAAGEDTDNRVGVLCDFVSERWERTRCVTIFTTNRGITKAVKGAPAPIEHIARPAFDRMTDGMMIQLKGPSFRGRAR